VSDRRATVRHGRVTVTRFNANGNHDGVVTVTVASDAETLYEMLTAAIYRLQALRVRAEDGPLMPPKHDAPTCDEEDCEGPLVPALADEYSHVAEIPSDHHLRDVLLCLSCGAHRSWGWREVAQAWWSQGAGDQAAHDQAAARKKAKT